MLLEDLATELVAHIFFSCSSIADVTNLAGTCRRFHAVFKSSRKLTIIASAVEAQYGPLDDAYQLVTHNNSQPAHIQRSVPLSEPLLRQVIEVGRAARMWEEMYPFRKWKDNSEDRRLLSTTECHIFRRALYRLWLYSTAFHNSSFPRYSRKQGLVIRERAKLLHNWTNAELAEIEDVHRIIRDVLKYKICPSNGEIQRKFRKRFPNSNHQLCFNINVHLNYSLASSLSEAPQYFFHQHRGQRQVDAMHKFRPTMMHDPGFEGWGDENSQYYVVEDMLKLNPAQVLWLKDNAPLKSQVERYVKDMGDWFENNGQTFGETLNFVLQERGADIPEFEFDLTEEIIGVAKVGWHRS